MKTVLATFLLVTMWSLPAAANGNGPTKSGPGATAPKVERAATVRKAPRQGNRIAYAGRSYSVPTIVGIAY